jgi:hypothetical protein
MSERWYRNYENGFCLGELWGNRNIYESMKIIDTHATDSDHNAVRHEYCINVVTEDIRVPQRASIVSFPR